MAEASEDQAKSHDTHSSVMNSPPFPGTAPLSLKRPASPAFHEDTSSSRKRFKESEGPADLNKNGSIIESKLADDLAQELECGCCSELLYKPVMVTPCQHFFCGRYLFFTAFTVSTCLLIITASHPVAASFGFTSVAIIVQILYLYTDINVMTLIHPCLIG